MQNLPPTISKGNIDVTIWLFLHNAVFPQPALAPLHELTPATFIHSRDPR